MVRIVTALFLVTTLTAGASASAADACAPLMEWNQFALEATTTAGQGALPQIRSLAIVHASMHDAVNSITKEYRTYRPASEAPQEASPEAAAIGAAHYALTQLFAAQVSSLDAKRAASLAACGLTESDAGVATGRAAAMAILALRAVDGAARANFPYTAPGAGSPGVFVAEGPAPVVAPGWGQVTPWVLNSGSQFRPEAPPTLDSGRYARDLNEVQALGALTGSSRTWEQTEIAKFWDGSPSAIWNSVARGVIAARGLNLSSTARAFALMYIAAADASIACFDAKYTYNFWRPITAIHNADQDGNDATAPDAAWQPLVTTHQHPEYPSGHSTNSSAMATVLALLFGDDPGTVIVATSPRNPTFPREWTTFSQGVDEVIDARVYIGFHFRTSDETGARVGRQVAHFVVNHTLRD
jgi:membrane-associated phospholipid phosphatase